MLAPFVAVVAIVLLACCFRVVYDAIKLLVLGVALGLSVAMALVTTRKT